MQYRVHLATFVVGNCGCCRGVVKAVSVGMLETIVRPSSKERALLLRNYSVIQCPVIYTSDPGLMSARFVIQWERLLMQVQRPTREGRRTVKQLNRLTLHRDGGSLDYFMVLRLLDGHTLRRELSLKSFCKL